MSLADTIEEEIKQCTSQQQMHISDKRMGVMKGEAAHDNEQQRLHQMVCQGWLAKFAGVPLEVRSYWNFHDTLTVEDRIIYKGDQVVVPTALHPDFLQ